MKWAVAACINFVNESGVSCIEMARKKNIPWVVKLLNDVSQGNLNNEPGVTMDRFEPYSMANATVNKIDKSESNRYRRVRGMFNPWIYQCIILILI